MTEQEFEKLYKDSYKAVYWTAMSLLKNKEETEDVVQDTFITAYNSYDTLKDKDKAVAWVKRIAANKCLNILTRRKTFNVEDEFFEETEAVGEDFLPESLVESEEKRRILMDIIKKCLSEDTFIIVVLFYFNELSAAEIAERLNMSQNSVFTRLNYARNKIKKEVERYEKDNDDKLFAAMGIPFLTRLFESESESVPFKPMPTSLQNIPASHATTGAAKIAATEAVRKGGKILMIKKLAVGALAVTLVGGCGVVVYKAIEEKKEPDRIKVTEEKTEPEKMRSDDQDVAEAVTLKEDEDTAQKEDDKIITADEVDKTGAYYIDEYKYIYSEDREVLLSSSLYVPEYDKVSIVSFKDSSGELKGYTWHDYNENTDLVRSWDMSEDGSEYTMTEYTYNEAGKPTYMISYDLNNNNAVRYYGEWEYDEQGRTLKETSHDGDGRLMNGHTYKYEADGSYCMSTDPSMEYVSNAYYDADHNILKSEFIHGDIYHYSLYYYENGNRVKCEDYNSDDGSLTSYTEYSYDGSRDGSCTSYTYYNEDGDPVYKVRYEYVDYDPERDS